VSPCDSLYTMLREQIQHEDHLINHRINWLLAAQGFLFLAYATILSSGQAISYKDAVLVIIGLFGFMIGIMVFLSVMSASYSLKLLRATWRERRDCCGAFPQIMFNGKWYFGVIGSGSSIALVSMLAWLFVMVITFSSIWTLPTLIGALAGCLVIALFFFWSLVAGTD
jgi:hypothetical protein